VLKKKEILYNPYFLFPFLLWVVVGGVLLLVFSRSQLFYAINTRYSDAADNAMYFATFLGQGQVIVPALLLLMIFPRFRNVQYFITALCCNIIPFFIQQILKSIFDHSRPHLLYYYETERMHYLQQWPLLYHRSFPSGHSQGAFSFFCFLSLLLPSRYRKLGLVFFLLAIAVCYSRIYLTAHFFDDIYAGSILGGSLTTIIYALMNKYYSPLINNKDTFI